VSLRVWVLGPAVSQDGQRAKAVVLLDTEAFELWSVRGRALAPNEGIELEVVLPAAAIAEVKAAVVGALRGHRVALYLSDAVARVDLLLRKAGLPTLRTKRTS
jgi:hypothetical protein